LPLKSNEADDVQIEPIQPDPPAIEHVVPNEADDAKIELIAPIKLVVPIEPAPESPEPAIESAPEPPDMPEESEPPDKPDNTDIDDEHPAAACSSGYEDQDILSQCYSSAIWKASCVVPKQDI
jgi:hypothetical protein